VVKSGTVGKRVGAGRRKRVAICNRLQRSPDRPEFPKESECLLAPGRGLGETAGRRMPTVDLATLGWNASFAEAFEPHRVAGLAPARVATEDKNFYTVVGENGDSIAVITGRLHLKKGNKTKLPKVGDWVAVTQPAPGEQMLIHAVLPRQTTLSRKLPGREAEEQVIATNLDVVFVVQALDSTFNLRRLERFLVMVHEGGAKPVVLLNKIDLCEEAEKEVAAVQAAIGPTAVIPVCAKTGKGTGKMREYCVKGATVAFIGTSGVGKSSLINRLLGEATQATLEVRREDSKGRHTTTWRELIPLPSGGLVVDTPGMREFHMWVAGDGLEGAFQDIVQFADQCRFRDCMHQKEPDCAVRAALAEGKITEGRYESFSKLQRELGRVKEERKQHAYFVNKRRSTLGTKAWLRND